MPYLTCTYLQVVFVCFHILTIYLLVIYNYYRELTISVAVADIAIEQTDKYGKEWYFLIYKTYAKINYYKKQGGCYEKKYYLKNDFSLYYLCFFV